MKLIIDTNIVFSALLKKENIIKKIIFSDSFEFYTCNFLFIEIFKHRNKLSVLSELTEDEILILLEKIFYKINFVNETIVSTQTYLQAFNLCKEVDPNDTPFIALSLSLNAKLLTGDKKLYDHLKSQNFNVISIYDLSNI